MLTDEDRNELINPGGSWPNKIVPFVTGEEYSEYCNTELQSGMWGVERIMCTA